MNCFFRVSLVYFVQIFKNRSIKFDQKDSFLMFSWSVFQKRLRSSFHVTFDHCKQLSDAPKKVFSEKKSAKIFMGLDMKKIEIFGKIRFLENFLWDFCVTLKMRKLVFDVQNRLRNHLWVYEKSKNEKEYWGVELDTLRLLDWRSTTRPTPRCWIYREGGIEESAHLATCFLEPEFCALFASFDSGDYDHLFKQVRKYPSANL